MNTAYLRRCADEERRAKIAAGFTMCATAPDTRHPPNVTSPAFTF
jgi:hypothetical protein